MFLNLLIDWQSKSWNRALEFSAFSQCDLDLSFPLSVFTDPFLRCLILRVLPPPPQSLVTKTFQVYIDNAYINIGQYW